MRIGLVAAMPEECTPLLRQVEGYAVIKLDRFPAFRFRAGSAEVCLVRAGMGPERAAGAAESLICAFQPETIISFGFGGGVLSGPEVGDLVIAERLLWLKDGRFTEQPLPHLDTANAVRQALAVALPHLDGHLHLGTFITTCRIENKRELSGRLPEGSACPLLEMESSAVARAAMEAGLPFVAVRAVSDDAGEELGFDLAEFCDIELNVSISRVLLALARKPWILPQLLRLSRNSRLAGKSLAVGIMALLENLEQGMVA